MSLNDKHRKVRVWLEKMYADEDVPPYEMNAVSIECLYSMMISNTSRDHDTQLIIEDMRQKTQEYHAEAERQNGILKQIGLDPHSLSQSGVNSLKTLARIAEILELKYTSDSCYLLALRRLDKDLARVAEERRIVQREKDKFFEKKRIFLLKSIKWKKALEDCEQERVVQRPQIASREKSTVFLQAKAKEYRRQEQKYFARLQKLNLETCAYHSELVNKAEALESLNEEMKPMRERLNSYYNLPPDITMTRVKIEELKQQLEFMEQELNRQIDVIHM